MTPKRRDRMENRRRTYFIKKEFQRNFILKFCGLVVAGSVISGSIVYFLSKSAVTTTFVNSRLAIKSAADFILPAVLLSSAIVVGVIGIAAMVLTLLASHRLAGPLYRVEKDFEEVAGGNLKKKFTLRKTDELQSLAVNLETIVESLREDIGELKTKIDEIEPTLVSEASKERIKDIKKILGKFVT